MRKVIKTGLPDGSAPVEWATVGGKTLYTASIPIYADGSIETGDIATQTELTLRNLRQTIEAAGGTPENIIKVTVWLKDPSDREALNAEWTRMFPNPESRPARHATS